MGQYVAYSVVPGWHNKRHLEFLREYLAFLAHSPTKRKHQKWLRVKKVFHRPTLDFIDALLSVKKARKITLGEIGDELLEELEKVKSDSDLDFGPTMTEDGRRVLAIDAETVSRARAGQTNEFNSLIFDRFVELNGYLCKFVLSEMSDGFLADSEIVKRIHSSAFHGNRPSLTQLKNWIQWMAILEVMVKVGFRLKLTAKGLESLEYLSGIPEEELLESEEDEEDEDEEGEEDAPEKKARRRPKPPEEDDLDDGEDDLRDDHLDEEGLDLPPEPGGIARSGLDPEEEAFLAHLEAGPQAVTGLSTALNRPTRALKKLLGEMEKAARESDEELVAEQTRPRRRKKKKVRAAPKRASVTLESEEVAEALDQQESLPASDPDPMPFPVPDDPESPEDTGLPLALEQCGPPLDQALRQLTEKLKGNREAVEAGRALKVELGKLVDPGYAEDTSEALLKNRARILRWWADFPDRTPVTAASLGIDAQKQGDPRALLFVLLAAGAVLRQRASTDAKLRVYRLLHQSGALTAYYYERESLDTLLEKLGHTDPARISCPLFIALLDFPLLRKSCTDGALPDDLVEGVSTAELAGRLDSEICGDRLGAGLLWVIREGRGLGLWKTSDGDAYSSVPGPVAMENAYRLGFAASHYAGDTRHLLRSSEALSRYFREAEGYEAPLAHFSLAHGCRFHCPWTQQCPYICREKRSQHRFS